MLEIPDSGLMFPIIQYAGKTSRARGGKDCSLFTLNWNQQEHELKQTSDDAKSLARFGLDLSDVVTGLPFPYDGMVHEARFAISDDYMDEIRRMTRAANYEWAKERPFDTCVREMCLAPAVEYIWAAFYLISDCLWNADEHHYDRSWLSYVMKYMLPYKFWRGQTGAGLVCDHAKIDRAKLFIDRKVAKFPNSDEVLRNEVIQFITAIESHEGRIRKESDQRTTVCPTVDSVHTETLNPDFKDIFNPSPDDGLFPVDKEKE